MRFKGTFILLIVCLALGGYLYFYEIKGSENREKAREAESRLWMLESEDIQRIELLPPGRKIVAVRKNQEEWAIREPRPLEADSGELNRIAEAAAGIKFESVLDESASDPSKYGFSPDGLGIKIKTADEKEYEILFGSRNPAGDAMYARVPGRNKIFLVSASLSGTFDKKLDDLRNHTILSFETSGVRALDLKNTKGDFHLDKDSDDRWWITRGSERIAADSPQIRGILNALSLGEIPEFFDEDPENYRNPGLKKPRIELVLAMGKDKALKRFSIGTAKAELREKETPEKAVSTPDSSQKLYLAKDASRSELFFVEQDLVNKLDVSFNDLRDKSLASFQRWDVDSIILENPNGLFTFTKSGGEWFLGEDKKKAKFEAVYGVMDALESDALELIESPADLSAYGLDQPDVQVILKQGDTTVAECSMGKKTEKGVYAQLKGDSSVKIADRESYEKLIGNEADFIETEAPDDSGAGEQED